tara:strand:+ start:3849 stop:4532 length:684 start_codon:yes stop_codon:yes gene_type:complete
MLQRLLTTKLFYNKYVFKLRLQNPIAPIYRGMNLGWAKTKLDEMQMDAEADLAIKSPFRAWRGDPKHITLETFMDNCVIYKALERNKDNCMVRIEGHKLDIYSNENIWLEELADKIGALEFHEPANDDNLNFLLENKNTQIVKGDVEWPYKAFFTKRVDPNFVNYCEANSHAIRIGSKAKQAIKLGHYTEGFYFFTKNERYLMLAKIAIGGSISKIVKYVSEADLNK